MDDTSIFADSFEQCKADPDFQAGLLRLMFFEDALRIMKDKAISRTELAARLGCSRAYISKLFKDTGNISIQTLVRIAMALDSEVSISVGLNSITSPVIENATPEESYHIEHEASDTDGGDRPFTGSQR
jgi:transcriptional regulator with XRE-family HTH domain